MDNPYVKFNERNSAALDSIVKKGIPRKLATSIVKNSEWLDTETMQEVSSGSIVKGSNLYVENNGLVSKIYYKSPQAGEHCLENDGECSCGSKVNDGDLFHQCLLLLLRGWIEHRKFIISATIFKSIAELSS